MYIQTMSRQTDKQSAVRLAEIISKGMAGKSRVELARLCGVTPQSVNGWITTGKVSKKYLPMIAEYIGVDPIYLINEEPPRAIYDPAHGSGYYLQKFGRGTRLFDDEQRRADRVNALLQSLEFLTNQQIETIAQTARAMADENRAAFFMYLENKPDKT